MYTSSLSLSRHLRQTLKRLDHIHRVNLLRLTPDSLLLTENTKAQLVLAVAQRVQASLDVTMPTSPCPVFCASKRGFNTVARQAKRNLAGVADLFVVHNREGAGCDYLYLPTK